MQAGSIYREGQAVFAKNEGDGKDKMYVEEDSKSGKYKLRKGRTKARDIPLCLEIFSARRLFSRELSSMTPKSRG